MPKLEVEGVGTFDVEEDRHLVLAVEEDAGVDIMHSCESYARCTTCSVEVLEGEPEIRSCKCFCDRNVKVRVLMTVSSTGARDPGWKPQKGISPKPFGVQKPWDVLLE